MDSANSVVFCGGVHGKLPMATSTGSAFITRRGYTGDISALRTIVVRLSRYFLHAETDLSGG